MDLLLVDRGHAGYVASSRDRRRSSRRPRTVSAKKHMEAHTEVSGHPHALSIPALAGGISSAASDPAVRLDELGEETRRRDRVSRRTLALADIAASLLAAYLALTLLG